MIGKPRRDARPPGGLLACSQPDQVKPDSLQAQSLLKKALRSGCGRQNERPGVPVLSIATSSRLDKRLPSRATPDPVETQTQGETQAGLRAAPLRRKEVK